MYINFVTFLNMHIKLGNFFLHQLFIVTMFVFVFVFVTVKPFLDFYIAISFPKFKFKDIMFKQAFIFISITERNTKLG